MPTMQYRSNLIQDILQQRNISLRRLAADAGISPSTLSRWASGKQTPSPQCCRKFAESLLLPVEDVLVWAGHLSSAAKTDTMEVPDYKSYSKRKYSVELQEDMVAMIEDLIQECYPSPCIWEEAPQQQACTNKAILRY
ncbi:helix-turn-helix domain-containing protein [Chloroflexota bacterium]